MRVCCFVVAVGLMQVDCTIAQDDAAAALDWDVLIQQRDQSYQTLKALAAEAREKPAERERIALEYREIVDELVNHIFPALAEQVISKTAESPDDETVLGTAHELMSYYFDEMDYPRAKSISEALIRADPENTLAINVAGVTNFAEHDFENAARILNLAKKNGRLAEQLGGRYLESAEVYVDYWQREQQLREQENAASPAEQLPRVKLVTSRGEIIVELFENEAPNTVANFVSLVEKHFYDGLTFHRVVPQFMAQGGCPFSKTAPERAGSGGPGHTIHCEAYRPDARRHFSGSLSMAHAGKDTGGSQFFITHLPTPHLDKEIAPESVHTVFGRVIEGLDVARALRKDDVIQQAIVIRKRDHEYTPKTQPE